MPRVTVTTRHLRQAPRKVRLVTDLIRGQMVDRALEQLELLPKRAAHPVQKLVKSAVSAAKAQGLVDETLWISQITCDQGAALKRRRLNSRGRASLIKKLTSHITVTISDEKKPRKGRS